MAEIMMDTLTIGRTKIAVKLMELNQADLNFYPDNPRVYTALNSDGTTPSQEDIEEHMKFSDLIVVEANYDRTLLEFGPYPFNTKRRIAGIKGHPRWRFCCSRRK